MGNACCGRKSKKEPVKPSPEEIKKPEDSKKVVVNEQSKETSKPEETDKMVGNEDIAHSNIRRNNKKSNQKVIVEEDKKENPKHAEKETNISRNDYSFAKITKTSNNQFSFEAYGEGVSALNPKFFLENLGNISHNSKINLSRNELLLLTEENKELLKFLSANNISKQDLLEGIRGDNINGSLALDNKLTIAPNFRPGILYFYSYI